MGLAGGGPLLPVHTVRGAAHALSKALQRGDSPVKLHRLIPLSDGQPGGAGHVIGLSPQA